MFKWLDNFRKGQIVANPEAWKKGQITVAILTPLILGSCSILSYFGIDLQVDETLANQIALAIISVVTVVLTITTTKKIGLSAKAEDPNAGGQPTDTAPKSDPTASARKVMGGK
jgi:uncharacterized membrane protein